MHHGLRRAPFALILAAAFSTSYAGLGAIALAQDDADQGAAPAVARIAAVDGQVGVKHGDGGAESAAAMNAPLIAGDYLTTGDDGRAEVQLDANTILRAGSSTQLRFTQVDGQADVAQIAQGTLELRVLASDPDQIQVQTPSVDVEPSEPGAYLVTVEGDGTTEVTARSGSLSVVTPQGTQEVDPGRTMLVSGDAANPQYRYEDEVAVTGVEQWGDQRDQSLLADAPPPEQDQSTDAPPGWAPSYAQGAPQGSDVAGLSDLDQDGNWVDIPGYGNAWVPSDVGPSWTPYSDGTWAYEPYYGYTWVASEPWGWAPYHYGRWAYAAPYGWAWVPGQVYARPAWSPALVAFFGFGGRTGIGIGFSNVGWVPLAPGEAYRPWWGGNSLSLAVSFNGYRNYAHGFIGVPYDTWQHGVIRNARPLSGAFLASTRFYGGSVAVRATGFNTRFTGRAMGALPQPRMERFAAMRPYASARIGVRSTASWQRFGAQRQSFAQRESFAQPQQRYQSYNRSGYQTSNRGYQTYNRNGYQTYNRNGYQTYNRSGYQTYNRGYQAQPQQRYQSYNRSGSQSYNRGYRSQPQQRYQSYNRSGYQTQRATRGSSSRGDRPHGPGRP